jgi:hypothetical protein
MKNTTPTRRSTLLGSLLAATILAAPQTHAQSPIRPGDVWADTDGKPINAHGGGVLYHEGTYYWYGELKEGRTYLPEVNKSWGGTRVIAGGVSCYSSKNLTDWQNHGLALPSDAQNPMHDLACEKVIERPKVIYNAKTKTFVMWLHQDSPDYAAARSGVATSATPTGPFRYLHSVRPNAGSWPQNATDSDKKANFLARDHKGGQMARDMTLFADDDGKAYHIYSSENNETLHIALLSDDYLKHTGTYARAFPGRKMEAPAMFKRKGKYYLIASGCTGWDPNPARSAVADHPLGPWTELPNPCRGEKADITFESQSTYVLQVVGKPDTYIAMFDRWKKWDLPDSRYVWLPITFNDKAQPEVHWQAAWTPEVGK